METINRYIYAVTQRLPQSQREDISIELRGLIEDMLDERTQDKDATDKDVEEVLLELGNPKHLAQQYRGSKRYLIGPEFFDTYICVLKIVLCSIIISMGVIFAIEIILNPIAILDHFVGFIVSMVTTIPQAIGWVTIGFVLIDYFGGVKAEDLKIEKTWKPSDLSPIPNPKRQIKRSEPIVSIVFYVLVIMLFAFSSNYFGIYVFKDDELSSVIPFLNEETFSSYLLFIILILGISILKESLKLITGEWTLKLVLYTVLIHAVSLIAVFFMITGPAFWNPDFMAELAQAGIVTEGSEGYNTVNEIWSTSTLWILIFLIVGLVWDAINGFIKLRK
ncbi:hypothetical protein LG329_09735 [Virgibacillus necropolis]|uniref:HAAS signaling domain-containing protein n=1 Tax=Virgibacillus necropolis TaxID=163877 RepID=UPI00384F8578